MRVVLVRLSALGDIIHTWPLAEAIRAARPDDHLTWAVEEVFAPLVDGHPAVDAVIPVPVKRWRRRPMASTTRAEAAAVRSRFAELAPDLAIDAQGTLKSAVVTRWTGADRRVGLARPWRRELAAGLFYTDRVAGCSSHPHVVATNLELVRSVGATPAAEPPAPDGRWLLPEPVAGRRDAGGRPAVLLPGAGRVDKTLSVETMAEVARHLRSLGLDVTIAWGPSEETRARRIADEAGDGVAVAPPTGILELAALLAPAALVVGGDTGPVHLAASLGVPTVAVFLTTDAARNRPLGARTAVVSGAAPGRGPGGSATVGRARSVSAEEIRSAIGGLLESER